MFSCHKNKDQLPNNENLKRKTQSTGKIKQINLKREHNACFLDNEWKSFKKIQIKISDKIPFLLISTHNT